jgi:hypothetical protein
MKHAANPRDFSPEMLLPRIRANARPDDFLPVEQMQLMKFDGEAWRAFGDVINGEVGHQPASGKAPLAPVQPALSRTPARRNFCGSTASPSIRVS